MDPSRTHYDAALMGILQNEGKLDKFLDAIMGFLYRRTDFFMLLKSKDGKLGFPPGVSARILIAAYEKYESMARNSDKQIEAQALTVARGSQQPVSSTDSSLPSSSQAVTPESKLLTPDCVPSVGCEVTVDHESQSAPTAVAAGTDAKSKEKNQFPTDAAVPKSLDQATFQANPESHNGAVRDKYSWSQTIRDIDIRIKVPFFVKKGKDVNVLVTRRHLSVSYKDNSNGNQIVVVDDDLPWDINKEESTWTLIPGDHVHANLEKVQERWWDCAFTNESKIDVQKIEAVRPMSDLDDEAQSKIEELMYNDRQKKLGLPTTQEANMHNLLKQAWDAEGSPFKGQPFDPSTISVSPDGSSVNIGTS